jgi:predicted NAD/FAD-binding protein
MKIAIIGTGVSGLVSAYLLQKRHDITVFESSGHAGGHVQTLRIDQDGQTYDVDTGFVVFNTVTYPLFVRLLERLGVESQPTCMSFSVRCESSGLEYAGTSLNSLFAQRTNLLRPSFHRMLRDVLRFNRSAADLLEQGTAAPTLGQFLDGGNYSRYFREWYLGPMGAAIWSCRPEDLYRFPVSFFVRFFHNHGLLSVNRHHPWRVIRGGSKRYVDVLTQSFRGRIHLRSSVERVRRGDAAVDVKPEGQDWMTFDQVIFATHSDQALELLKDPSDAERQILGAMRYRSNDALLHTDADVLPANPRARASWNYHVPPEEPEGVVVTYDMSRLQGLSSASPICMSLNPGDRVRPGRVLQRLQFAHPLFDLDAHAAQQRHGEISGVRGTHYCGAYWGNGFHEDGVRSAQTVCAAFGEQL